MNCTRITSSACLKLDVSKGTSPPIVNHAALSPTFTVVASNPFFPAQSKSLASILSFFFFHNSVNHKSLLVYLFLSSISQTLRRKQNPFAFNPRRKPLRSQSLSNVDKEI